MESTTNKLIDLAKQFEVDGFVPPREVVQALMTLAGDALISDPVAATTQSRHPTTEADVAWDCMAIAGEVVMSVSGKRVGAEWHWSSDRGQTTPPASTVFGDLVPKSEIVGCRLLAVEGRQRDRWLTRWQLQLRSGGSLPLPWSATDRDGQQRHEELGLKLAKLLR